MPRPDPALLEDALRRVPLFGSLTRTQRAVLLAAGRVLDLGEGEMLWREGDPARHVALVLRGRLRVQRSRPRREVTLDVAVPGDILGEVALSLGASYQSDVVCPRHASVLQIPAREVRALLEQAPRVALALALDLAQQVVRLYRSTEDLACTSVEQRLARVLLRLAARAGEPFPGGLLIPVRLRRADLAAMAATTVESTSRKLAEWTRKGFVLTQPAGLLIRDASSLRRLIDDD